MCEKRKKNKKKPKKLSQFLKSYISGTQSLQFGMWSSEVGGSVHSKNRLVSSRQHRAMEVRKLRLRSSCQYTHGCCAPASWAARHTTMCLDYLLLLGRRKLQIRPGGGGVINIIIPKVLSMVRPALKIIRIGSRAKQIV